VVASARAKFPVMFAAALLLGLYLQWPSLEGGFRSDDYVQWAMLQGLFTTARSQFDLFDFASGHPADYRALVDFGYLPFWTVPALRLRMLRPLSSALIALDHRLFGAQPFFHHLHSLLWFGFLLFAAGRLLWRSLPPRAASLALLLFAAGPCHTLPVGWLANRSTLIASSFGLLAVELFVHGRSLRQRIGCALLASLALAAGEYALATLAYGIAYALLGTGTQALSEPNAPPEPMRKPGLRARLVAAWPIVLPVCVYLALHSLLGSDIVHSGYYLSPLHDPSGFARALVTRVPVLVADLLFGLPSLYWNGGSPLRALLLSWNLFSPAQWVRLPDWTTWQVLIGYLACAAGFWLWRVQRTAAGASQLSWLGLGALLALLPMAGSLPEDRLLGAATLGACALVASLTWQIWDEVAAGLPLPRLLRAVLLLACLAWFPISAIYRSHDDVRSVVFGSEVARVWCRDADLPAQHSAETRVYVLAAADFNTAANLPWLRRFYGQPLPRAYRRLAPGALPLDVTRVSENVLDVRVLTTNLRGTALPSLYRESAAALHRAERFRLPGLAVEVLQIYDDNPSWLRFSFDRSIDDPLLWFVVATEHGLRHRNMPPIGETERFPQAQYRDLR
jgi:hypothetical protein